MRDYFESPAFKKCLASPATLRDARAAARATLRGERWTDEMIENARTWRGGNYVRRVRRRRRSTPPADTPRAPAAAVASAPRRRFRYAHALSPLLSRARRADRTCAQDESRLHEAAWDGKVRRA